MCNEKIIELGYVIDCKLLNAVNYSVPQNRERLFVVGHQSQFTFPESNLKKLTVADAIGDLYHNKPARTLTCRNIAAPTEQ